MQLVYCHVDKVVSGGRNFGDDMNCWLWPKLLPGCFDESSEKLFFGIGTLLNDQVPLGPKKVIFGSGVGYGAVPRVDNTWDIHCLRGPLSAKALKAPDSKAVTDPSILIRHFFDPSREKNFQAAYIPHWTAMMEQESFWHSVCHLAGIQLIDPRWPLESVLAHINQSELVIAEAMHGAIMADTLRVPWIPVKTPRVLNFKWKDWTSSLELPFKPHRLLYFKKALTPLTAGILAKVIGKQFSFLANSGRRYLSENSVFQDRYSEINRRLERLKKEIGQNFEVG